MNLAASPLLFDRVLSSSRLAAFLLSSISLQAAWQPAHGPLQTRWTKDVSPEQALPEYPRPQMVRSEWLNLNGLWDFVIAPQSANASDQFPERYDAQILVPFPPESALSGLMKNITERDRLWYRRAFQVPAAWNGRRVLLHFGAVDFEATVFVNRKPLGRHRGGYDAFDFDITDALQPGVNEIIVSAWDPTDAGPIPRGKQVRHPDQGIFYTASSGIWQTVWLEPVTASHIEQVLITPLFDDSEVNVTVPATFTAAGEIHVEVLDGEAVVQTATATPVELSGTPTRGTVSARLKLPNARPWSPESPFLYGLRVTLRQGGKPVDSIASYFGLRKIALGKDNGVTKIFLNNRPYFMAGPLDQGFWPDGLYTAPTDEALRYDIEITKKLGFNMARKHVKVEPDRWYYWCDKLGLLVWQDMPSGDRFIGGNDPDGLRTAESASEFESELKAMIQTHQNHPCIIMWVVFNEGWGQYDTPRVVRFAKDLDPTRLVNNASGWTDRGVGDVHDMHNYPGPGSPKPEESRAAVLGEFGGLGFKVEGHTWAGKTWGYQGMADRGRLTSQYVKLLRGVYRLKESPGLSAAVYTQTTDVEYEGNGLLTYDREIVKMDLPVVAAANHGDFPPEPKRVALAPTALTKAVHWRYTMERPAEDWSKSDFDATGWKEGPAGFGSKGTPGALVGTQWNTADIWLRRAFTLPEGKLDEVRLLLHHDEDAEVYLNGVLAAKQPGYISDYDEFPLRPEARAALVPGLNTIAVHCHQTGGGQYIDVGLVNLEPVRR